MTSMTDKLSAMMEERNIDKAELSRGTGIPYTTIDGLWKRGTENIKRSTMLKLAKYFHCTLDYLGDDNVSTISNVTPLDFTSVPIVGTIACGTPILAQQNIEGKANIAGNIKADFALNIKGDSMDNAEIHNGDIVFIRQQEEVEDGEIAAVLIDEEATLKRFYRHGRAIELRPENPKYRSMIFTEDNCDSFKILGKAVACQHCFE